MTTAKSNTSTTSAVESELIQQIAISKLRVSINEARKWLDLDALKELADSISKQGVNEPLIVRPMGGVVTGSVDDLRLTFEIVAGQRRFEASKIAGKTTCPCIIRAMTNQEAYETAIVSNLQREDLPPLEQAMAFRTLLDVPGATVETVAAKLGKSASFVGRRLQLLNAIEPVREALQAGAIEVGHALELARLDANQQIRHLSRLNCGFHGDGDVPEDDDYDETEGEGEEGFDDDGEAEQEPAEETRIRWRPTSGSVAELRREIAATTLRVLSDAPFPLDDELPPMACTECPKRSGNAALLFDDCAQDTCTDRDCFDAKAKVWVKYELDQADKDKRKLLMLRDGYSSNKDVISDYDVVVVNDRKPVVPCESQEEAIWINGLRAGHRTMICRDPKCKIHQSTRLPYSEPKDPVKAKADRKKLLDKLKAEKKYRADLFKALAVAPINPFFTSDLNLEVCLYAIRRANSQHAEKVAEALGWPADIFGWSGDKQLKQKMQSLAPVERLRVALLAAHSGELAVAEHMADSKPEDFERLAGFLSVDAKKIRAGIEGKPETIPAKKQTPVPAKGAFKKPVKAPAKKAAPKKATPKKAAKKAVKKAPATKVKGGSK